MNRQRAEAAGRKGELAAEFYLRAKGWCVLARRRKTPLGEIDLVVRRSGVIAFVEVKWRKRPEELAIAIDEYRLRRVAAAAEAVAHEYATNGEDLRVDVILLAPGRMPQHIVNAWQP
ncbi:YraN family protein [Tsuneonella troitsensis]|uniref:YraN family protein n=1 Tax=Tsuneonella troitsensis TaxID=292222 RepID=UPI00070E763F|nr:YraN family protein [Tsuneonella troitsensis]